MPTTLTSVSKRRVLVVEDEPDVRQLVVRVLEQQGDYLVESVADGSRAIERLSGEGAPPDAVILDIMLPGVDGFDVCKALRRQASTARVAVLMLTARSDEADMIAGLEHGADDFLTKPFSAAVLRARLSAVLRRRASIVPPGVRVVHGALEIRPERCQALVAGAVLPLTAQEYRLLYALARRPGHVLTRAQLVRETHEGPAAVTARSIDIQVLGLRRKLGEQGELVETVRGIGYRFRDSPL